MHEIAADRPKSDDPGGEGELLRIASEEDWFGEGAGGDDDRRYDQPPDWTQSATGYEPDGEADGESARRGQEADGKQRAGNRFGDRGQDRYQWRVGPVRRSTYCLAVQSATKREPLGAVETRWKGTHQHPPANGQQENPGCGEQRADPIERLADHHLAGGHESGPVVPFVLAGGNAFSIRAHRRSGIGDVHRRTAVTISPLAKDWLGVQRWGRTPHRSGTDRRRAPRGRRSEAGRDQGLRLRGARSPARRRCRRFRMRQPRVRN